MSSKKAKCYKQEQRIKQLENEVEDLKRALEQQTKTVQFDEQQMSLFIDEFVEQIKCVNKQEKNKISSSDIVMQKRQSFNMMQMILKIALCSPFTFVIMAIIMFYFNAGVYYWNLSWDYRFLLFVIGMICFDCVVIITEIFKEKDRNFIVSLFAALVALVSLIVTLTNR